MSYIFINRPNVKNDINNVIDYYKRINPSLAKQFLIRIKEAKDYINNTPLGFQIKYKEVRTLLLKKFPYHIHYIIDENKRQIIILAVIHAYRNPADYTNR